MRIKMLYNNCVFAVSQIYVLPSTVWVQSYTHTSAYVCIKYIIGVVVVVIIVIK